MTRYHRSFVATGVLLASLCLTRHADASDWYVDSVTGNDASNGTTPGSAWKTITHALATLSSGTGPETVHVAAGTYSVLSGEVFPLPMRDQLQVVGDAGAASTLVVAHAVGSTGFRIATDLVENLNGVGPTTMLSGLTIQGHGTGIDIMARTHVCDPTLHDLVLRDCGTGVRVTLQPIVGASGPSASPLLSRVECISNGAGLFVSSGASFSGPLPGRIHVEDAAFVGNYSGAVFNGFGRPPEFEIVRSRFLDHAAFGVQAVGPLPPGSQGTIAILRDCLFARNAVGGARLDFGYVATLRITGCTFADSPGYGFRASGPDAQIVNTIAWGNHPDAQLSLDPEVRHCDIGSPTFAGMQGSISADPLFLNAPGGDYRLRFGSPCVDRGEAAAGSLIDVDGHSRRIDGDLDTVGAPDMGALELLPLHLTGVPSIGHTIGLEFLGASDSISSLYVAHAALAAPTVTPFGVAWLPMPPTFVAVVHVQAGPPFVLRRRIPGDPVWIGRTLSFQALTESVLAPHGVAWTNPVTFVIQP